jgi:hypothetical protein
MKWSLAVLNGLPFRLKVCFLVLIKIETGKKKSASS